MNAVPLSRLTPADILDPEAPGARAINVYRIRRGAMEVFEVARGRERSTGRAYYTILLADGYRTFGSLAALKKALRA